MILRLLFPHLRRSKPGKFFASHLLTFYGQLCIGGPKVDDLPKQAPIEVRERIVGTWFDHSEDRLPEKRLEKWEVGQLKAAQLRDEEEKWAAVRAFLYSVCLVLVLYGLGAGVNKAASGVEARWAKHKAEAAAEEAREYAAKRDTLMKEWAADIAGYSTRKCIDEVSDLRDRKTDQKRDRYTALQQGCADKRADIEKLAKTWSLDDCTKAGVQLNKVLADGGTHTWVDELIFRGHCYPTYGDALKERLK
ncbi:hypothetical protein [Pseudoxanthomonas kaohsiungensis]|uniref:Uncharacterized protein n=1 Tax=Pseudoxanthomonas kaohsiungensis TaxID=283923 RepID=A0ABW3LRL3_9GAMM|nr:hypothetical protein [Pseudoxanthomonas kaohsiungensis]KAF1704288.1 hypothetical protein CSC66_05450 [Pseudoxanthomonas kaohsiungensis]